jgi:hypothetical protein
MKVLHPTAMKHSADYLRTQHHVVVDPDVEISDILVPKFWCHYAARLRKFDLIDVIGQGFDITLRVHEIGNGYVNTVVIREWVDKSLISTASEDEEQEDAPKVPDGYVVDHNPKTLWRVRMKDSGSEISRNHKTKPEAIGAAIEHNNKALGIAA